MERTLGVQRLGVRKEEFLGIKRISGTVGCALAVCVWGLCLTAAQPNVSLRGFFPADAGREAEFERAFRAQPTAERVRQDLQILSQAPHVAGTPEDYQTAQYVFRQFHDAGLEAKIVEYQVLLPMPKEVKVDLVDPFKRSGPTPEGGWTWDPDASDSRVVPAFNAYSPSGDVTERVVYANYGLPADYDHLKELGIDVAGKVVVVRYGRSFRGVKAYVAEQSKVAGLLLYSDPADDGYRQGDTYPQGPWRPPTSVQRGSILYMTAYAGDPLTPGYAATPGAKRLSLNEAKTLPHIPTTPISYADAAPILQNLTGPVAPSDWQGALPFTYHVGPGLSKAHLKLEMDFQTRPIWDVVAEIPGDTLPEWWVVLGNHRDAWTYGAVDPNSGTAPLLAVARGLGHLLQQGWKPRRTIVLGSWDAEEFGLIGSTEWAEDHADQLTRNAVAYLNMDVGVSGPYFAASAVPSLARLIREVAQDVTDPKSGRSLYAVWFEQSRRLRRETRNPIAVWASGPPSGPAEARVGELGSGSDYTPFIQHLGVPSLSIGFEGPYGVYHSVYDNFRWMQNFGDPTFQYGVAAGQIFGTLGLRLANADILPLDYEDYGKQIRKYFHDFQDEIKGSRQANQMSLDGPLRSVARFTDAAKVLGKKIARATASGVIDPSRLVTLNRALLEVERDFLLEQGLPDRAWFRHALYAPGVYTGYDAVVIPGVREAVDRKDWTTAGQQLDLIREALDRGTATLTRAQRALDQAPRGVGASAPPGSTELPKRWSVENEHEGEGSVLRAGARRDGFRTGGSANRGGGESR